MKFKFNRTTKIILITTVSTLVAAGAIAGVYFGTRKAREGQRTAAEEKPVEIPAGK